MPLFFVVVVSIRLPFTFFSLLFHRRLLSHFFQTNKTKNIKKQQQNPPQNKNSNSVCVYMVVSKKNGTPKSSILIGFSIKKPSKRLGCSLSFRGYRWRSLRKKRLSEALGVADILSQRRAADVTLCLLVAKRMDFPPQKRCSFRSSFFFFGWLLVVGGWLVGRLVGRSVGRSVGWLFLFLFLLLLLLLLTTVAVVVFVLLRDVVFWGVGCGFLAAIWFRPAL